jgi:hypothetical protein
MSDMSKKATAKKPKVAPSGNTAPVKTAVKKSIVKVIRLKAKPGLKCTSEMELILAKPIGVSNKIFLSDVPGSSQIRRDEGHRVVEMFGEQAPHMITFDNHDDEVLKIAKKADQV